MGLKINADILQLKEKTVNLYRYGIPQSLFKKKAILQAGKKPRLVVVRSRCVEGC